VSVTSGKDSHQHVTGSPEDGTQAELVIQPEFLSYKGTAAVLSLSTREIYRLVEAGELVVHEYKRRKLIDSDSVRALAGKIRNGDFAEAAA
jgi:hypothetical protein